MPDPWEGTRFALPIGASDLYCCDPPSTGYSVGSSVEVGLAIRKVLSTPRNLLRPRHITTGPEPLHVLDLGEP
jgi:hypothetical protein